MAKQPIIPGLRDAMKKMTRREQFLPEMDAVVPWGRLIGLIGPHAPKAGPKGGGPPMPLETMLRVHFLKNWYALSHPMAEEILEDVLGVTVNELPVGACLAPTSWMTPRPRLARESEAGTSPG